MADNTAASRPSDQPAGAVRKAVIPAAGMGTRFLPASKAVPKEMAPLVDRPAIEYVIQEAARAGCDDVLLISARGKETMEDHFDRAPQLEEALQSKGKDDLLEQVVRSAELARVHSVRQHEAKGLGHAVLAAADHVGDEPFACMLPDDIIAERDHLLERMVQVQAERGGSVVALLDVPHEQISMYGAATVESTDEDDVVVVHDLVEKPDPEDAPSDLAIIGRYVLHPEVFAVLRETEPGKGGEIQLTDAIKTLAGRSTDEGGPVHGVVFRGGRYDTGDKQSYLQAVVTLAAEREDLGPEFLEWLNTFVKERGAS